MPINLTIPTLPFRPIDNNSKYIASGLALAYVAVDGNNLLKNYGYVGSVADIGLSNTSMVRQGGIVTTSFNGTDSLALSSSISWIMPERWTFAYWVKFSAIGGSEQAIFTLQGPSERHFGAWQDSQGIWSWQKHSIADSYSILPVEDFVVNDMVLVVAVYDNLLLPPAQLRSEKDLSWQPRQPMHYVVYNEAAGYPGSTIESIAIGSVVDGTKKFNGYLGPMYLWDRPLSDTEVWQLWQDPYAPFRRNSEQLLVPSSLTSSQGASLQGLGRSSGAAPIITDNNALYILVEDTHQYATDPAESTISTTSLLDIITINDSYIYQMLPTDSYDADAPFSLINISITDDYIYRSMPVDEVVGPETGVSTIQEINVLDGYVYYGLPTETLNTEVQLQDEILVVDNILYRNLPVEDVET